MYERRNTWWVYGQAQRGVQSIWMLRFTGKMWRHQISRFPVPYCWISVGGVTDPGWPVTWISSDLVAIQMLGASLGAWMAELTSVFSQDELFSWLFDKNWLGLENPLSIFIAVLIAFCIQSLSIGLVMVIFISIRSSNTLCFRFSC